jgi:hypothetical protein
MIAGLMVMGCGEAGVIDTPAHRDADAERADGDASRHDAGTPAQDAGEADSGPLDCGAQLGCMAAAAETCQESAADISITIDFRPLFPFSQKTDSHLEIQGPEGDLCRFYIRTDGIELTFDPEVPQEQQDESVAMAQQLVGRDGTCLFTNHELAAMLGRWSQGSSSTEDFEGAQCTGEYFSGEL